MCVAQEGSKFDTQQHKTSSMHTHTTCVHWKHAHNTHSTHAHARLVQPHTNCKQIKTINTNPQKIATDRHTAHIHVNVHLQPRITGRTHTALVARTHAGMQHTTRIYMHVQKQAIHITTCVLGTCASTELHFSPSSHQTRATGLARHLSTIR